MDLPDVEVVPSSVVKMATLAGCCSPEMSTSWFPELFAGCKEREAIDEP